MNENSWARRPYTDGKGCLTTEYIRNAFWLKIPLICRSHLVSTDNMHITSLRCFGSHWAASLSLATGWYLLPAPSNLLLVPEHWGMIQMQTKTINNSYFLLLQSLKNKFQMSLQKYMFLSGIFPRGEEVHLPNVVPFLFNKCYPEIVVSSEIETNVASP